MGYEIEAQAKDIINIVVCQIQSRLFGLEVNEIVDVLRTETPLDAFVTDRPGLSGNLSENEGIIVVVDVPRIWQMLCAKLGMGATKADSEASRDDGLPPAIFHVDDAALYRKEVKKLLESAGYEVVSAVDGKDAYMKLKGMSDGAIALLLSDIEMPKMNGLELAEKVRQDPRWKNIPMVALSSRFSENDIDLGRKAGFDAYLQKLDKDDLVKQVERALGIKGRDKA